MTDVVQRAKEALEGVTDGPWKAVNVGNVHWGVGEVRDDGFMYPGIVYAQVSYDGFGNGSRKENAEFIAAARELIPELIAEVEMLRSRPQEPDWLQRKYGMDA